MWAAFRRETDGLGCFCATQGSAHREKCAGYSVPRAACAEDLWERTSAAPQSLFLGFYPQAHQGHLQVTFW